MFESLKRWLGQPPVVPQKPESESPPPPVKETPEEGGFLRRSPIFNRTGHLVGHYLDFPSRPETANLNLASFSTLASDRSADMIILSLDAEKLMDPAVDAWPRHKFNVLLRLGNFGEIETLISRITQLKNAGLKVGFYRQPDHPGFSALIRHADIAAVDVQATDPDAIRSYSAAIRVSDPADAIRLLATRIDSLDEHQLCHQWHYDFFHGRFAEKAPPVTGKTETDPHKLRLMNLLRLVQSGAETLEIVAVLKQDPVLSFRILRYLNSPLNGLSQPVDSLVHALTLLGHQRLMRWLSVLMFSVRSPGFGDWLTIESALTRGRVMELLGGTIAGGHHTDDLFLTGIFSCLPRLLHRPIGEILDEIPVSTPVRDAIERESGPYAPLLSLAIACEHFELEKMQALSSSMGLQTAEVNRVLWQATTWAGEITADWD